MKPSIPTEAHSNQGSVKRNSSKSSVNRDSVKPEDITNYDSPYQRVTRNRSNSKAESIVSSLGYFPEINLKVMGEKCRIILFAQLHYQGTTTLE